MNIGAFTTFLLSLILSPLIVAAENPLPATVEAANCATTNDPYEKSVAVKFTKHSNSYAGDCMDTEKFRPAIVLEDNSEKMVVANIRHENKYWTLTLKKDVEVANVLFQFLRFPIVKGIQAAHAQVRFQLSDGHTIELVSQEDGTTTTSLEDIIVSWEASRPAGIGYNFAMGAFDNYALVGRLNSVQQRLAENPGKETEQHYVNIPSAERKEYLFNSIKNAHSTGFKKFYSTLKPNCTTTIFDDLDALPSLQKNNPEAFLTVISGDPVAGPSIQGLKDRKVWGGQAPSMTETDRAQLLSKTKITETNETQQFGFLAEVEGKPYALVLAAPAKINGVENSEALLAEVQKMAYESLPGVVQAVGSAMLVSNDSSAVLTAALKKVTEGWRQKLLKLEPMMPKQATSVLAYLVPWNPSMGEELHLQDLGVQARLPFNMRKSTLKGGSNNEARSTDTFYFIKDGILKASDAQYKGNAPAYFMGASVAIRLKKNYSGATMQALMGLNPQKQVQNVVNDKVSIHELQIIENESRADRNAMLVQVSQLTRDELPSIQILFGSAGGLNARPDHMGEFHVGDSITKCEDRISTAPLLVGKTAKAGLGVSFSIFSLDIDPEALRISDMDVKVNLFNPLKCISNDGVNDEFTAALNGMIEEQSEGLLEKVLDGLL